MAAFSADGSRVPVLEVKGHLSMTQWLLVLSWKEQDVCTRQCHARPAHSLSNYGGLVTRCSKCDSSGQSAHTRT
eukprot:6796835-Pyramimonas_sp.AAC.1